MEPFLRFYSGICVSGLTGFYLTWRWYFWIGTIMTLVALVVSSLSMPKIRLPFQVSTLKMDWWGCLTIVPGLVLIIFAFTDGSHAPDGWKTPYIIVTFIVGIALICAAVYIEGWVASQPLLPPDIFKVKYLTPLFFALSFSYGVFGVYLSYDRDLLIKETPVGSVLFSTSSSPASWLTTSRPWPSQNPFQIKLLSRWQKSAVFQPPEAASVNPGHGRLLPAPGQPVVAFEGGSVWIPGNHPGYK